MADRIAVPVGPLEVPAPSWEVHLVECALHAVVGDGLARALSLRDVAQVALDPRLDVDVAIRIAARWQLTDVLAEGLSGSMEGLGLVPPGELASAGRTVDPGSRVPASIRSARSRLLELRHGDPRRRTTVTRGLMAPSPSFLRRRSSDLPLPSLYMRRSAPPPILTRATDAQPTVGPVPSTPRRQRVERRSGTSGPVEHRPTTAAALGVDASGPVVGGAARVR